MGTEEPAGPAATAIMPATPIISPHNAAGTARDPVCGMTVNPADLKAPLRISRRDLPFLLSRLPHQVRCRSAENISTPRSRTRPELPVPEGTIYTCPMHPRDPSGRARELPDLRHGAGADDGHGSTTGPNPELADMTPPVLDRRACCTLPVFVLEMGGHLVGCHSLIDPALSNWIQLVFATPVVLWAGWPFFVRGWQSLRHAQPQHVHADRAWAPASPMSTAWSRPFCRRLFPATLPRP